MNNVTQFSLDLLQGGTPSITFKLVIHTKLLDYHTVIPISLDISSDYFNNHADIITITYMMARGDYHSYIYPYRDDINVSLIIERGGKDKVYRLIGLLDNIAPTLTGTHYDKFKHNDLNTDLVTVQMQLIDFSLLGFKTSTVSGVYKNCSMTDVLVKAFSDNINDMSNIIVGDKMDCVITPANNANVFKEVIIDNTLPLLSLPRFLQKKHGVYNSGINLYKEIFSKNSIFIYPPLRNENETKVIIHVNRSNTATVGKEASYGIVDNVLHIVGGNVSMPDNDYANEYNIPSTVSAIVPDTLSKRSHTTSMANVTVKQNDLSMKQIKDTKIPSSLTPATKTIKTNNLFDLRSKALSKELQTVQVLWENSKFSLLYPNMKVELLVDNVSYDGVLSHRHTTIENKHENTTLTISLERNVTPSNVSVTKLI